MTIQSLKLGNDPRGLSTALNEDSSFLMSPALREIVWGSLDILWGAARQATRHRAGGQEWAAVCVHTDTASKKPRWLCLGVFSNLSWHTGDRFDFTPTAQALLTLKSQQFNTKWLKNKQRITSGCWFSPGPSLLLSVTQPWSTFDGNWVSRRDRWCQTCHAAGSPESNCVSISVCDLALI